MPRCVRFTWRPAACPQTDGSAPSRSAYPIRTPRRTPVLCHAKLKAWESMSQRQRASAGALGCQGRGSAFPSRITLCRQGWLQRGPRLGLRSCPEERDESAHWTVDATTDAVHEWFRRQLDPRGGNSTVVREGQSMLRPRQTSTGGGPHTLSSGFGKRTERPITTSRSPIARQHPPEPR